MAYAPAKDSAAWKACRYFRDHPNARLNARQLAGKLELDVNKVVPLLASALNNRVLERAKVEDVWHYAAGPRMDAVDLDGTAAPAPVMRATSAPPPPVAAPTPPVAPPTPVAAPPATRSTARIIGGYAIDRVPVNPGKGTRANVPRRLAFEAMAVGESVALSRHDARNFIQAANKWGRSTKRRFAQQRIDATHTRVGRVE